MAERILFVGNDGHQEGDNFVKQLLSKSEGFL